MFSYGTNNVIDLQYVGHMESSHQMQVVSQLCGTHYHFVCLTSVQEQSEQKM